VETIGFGRGIFGGRFLLESGLREEDRAGFVWKDGALVIAGVSGFAFPDEGGNEGVVELRLFEFPFFAGLQPLGRKSPAKSEAGDPELPDEALLGREIVEVFYVAELALT
jgi:hypothetical protein